MVEELEEPNLKKDRRVIEYDDNEHIVTPPMCLGIVSSRLVAALQVLKAGKQLDNWERSAFGRGNILLYQGQYFAEKILPSNTMANYYRGDSIAYEMILEILGRSKGKKDYEPGCKTAGDEIELLRKKLHEASRGSRENLEELILFFNNAIELSMEKTSQPIEWIRAGDYLCAIPA